jgi:hypothetical protein
MITVFVIPELFDSADSLFPVRVKRPPTEDPQSPVNAFAASFRAPADFEFLVKVLRKNAELRIALFSAIREEGFVPFRG